MNDTTTTALYLFSSLLQADAAILGFGAVFVVYRLQAAETERQKWESRAPEGEPETQEQYDAMMLASAADYIPRAIKRLFWIPLSILSVHISLCAVLLWFTPQISFSGRVGTDIVAGVIALFAIGVLSSSWFTWHLLSYDLRKARVDQTEEHKKFAKWAGKQSTESLVRRIIRKMKE